MRSDLGNLLKALGRLEEAKVCYSALAFVYIWVCASDFIFWTYILVFSTPPPATKKALDVVVSALTFLGQIKPFPLNPMAQ